MKDGQTIIFCIFFLMSLATFMYGLLRDDIRILIGFFMMYLCVASVSEMQEYNTYICEGIDGIQTARTTSKKRWTLSNGESYHTIDFHKKCKRTNPPTN